MSRDSEKGSQLMMPQFWWLNDEQLITKVNQLTRTKSSIFLDFFIFSAWVHQQKKELFAGSCAAHTTLLKFKENVFFPFKSAAFLWKRDGGTQERFEKMLVATMR